MDTISPPSLDPSIDPPIVNSTCVFLSKNGKRCLRPANGSGGGYCNVHQPVGADTSRVQCVMCHQWVRSDSKRHQSVCSGFTASLQPYYEAGVNKKPLEAGLSAHMGREGAKVDEIPEKLYYKLIEKVQFLYDTYVVPRLEREADFDDIDGDSKTASAVGLSEKHRSQETAIINLMEEAGLVAGFSSLPRNPISQSDDAPLSSTSCYVDFGAGKGSLSRALFQDERVRGDSDALFVLIERDALKHKAELSKESRSFRARIDLADVRLAKLVDLAMRRGCGDPSSSNEGSSRDENEIDKIPSLSRSCNVVGIGKHLCGSATDLAIAAMVNMTAAASSLSSQQHVGGICIALCCHSKSSWDCLTSRAWLEHVGGVTEAEFELMRRWSGFTAVDARQRAIMQSGPASSSGNDADTSADNTTSVGDDGAQAIRAFPWRDYVFRERLGRMCKRVIDIGRVHYIEESLGLQCRLVTYVGREVTPENVVLLAYPKPK